VSLLEAKQTKAKRAAAERVFEAAKVVITSEQLALL
jgi:hypothetical protein